MLATIKKFWDHLQSLNKNFENKSEQHGKTEATALDKALKKVQTMETRFL